MKNLKPTSQLTEVLFYLLKRNSITFKQIHFDCGILNLSARISDLRNEHLLDIPCKKMETINKFGRNISYGSWSLTNKEKGLKVYNKLVKIKDRG